jgi:hypothetical protein
MNLSADYADYIDKNDRHKKAQKAQKKTYLGALQITHTFSSLAHLHFASFVPFCG